MAEFAHEFCTYCGLPVAGVRRLKLPPDTPLFCCSGCRLAESIRREYAECGSAQRTVIRIGLAVFFTMNVMVFSMALWSHEVYMPDTHEGAGAWTEFMRYGALVFSIPVLLLLGGPLVQSAWEGWSRREVRVDQLLVLGVCVAFGYSWLSILTGEPHIYLEVGCVILVAVTIGRWFEAVGRHRAMEVLDGMHRLLPDRVRRISAGSLAPVTHGDGESGKGDHQIAGDEWIPLDVLRWGDWIRVLPGERIAADGRLESPFAVVDEQLITGESLPREKTQGDAVCGGALNLACEIVVHVTVAPETSTVRKIAAWVRDAALSRGPYQVVADRLTAWFIPSVCGVALVTFAWHWRVHGFGDAWMTSMAVVLIACPCALAIATPLAVWSAVSHAASRGVLIRNGDALDRLSRVDTVYFDKTGTLTTGDPRFAGRWLQDEAESKETLAIAMALASRSTHPLARALTQELADQNVAPAVGLKQVQELPGLGLWADAPGPTASPQSHDKSSQGDTGSDGPPRRYVLGSIAWAASHGCAAPATLSQELDSEPRRSQAVVCLGWGGFVRAVFWWSESIRDTVDEVLLELHRDRIATCVLTGDRPERAAAFRKLVPLAMTAQLLPHEKMRAIQDSRKAGHVVAMVGDGLNDAPSLAAADVGIAMGTGADLSRQAAGVCLLNDDLLRIPWLLRHARKTRRTVLRNLLWAFGYNIVGIGIAAAGWLNPILAAIAMVASSLLVITESLRLAAPRAEMPFRVACRDAETADPVRFRE